MSLALPTTLRGPLGAGIVAAAAAFALATGAARVATPVHADTPAIAVTVSEDGVSLPDTIAPGFETLTITNTGANEHSVQLFRLNEGVTVNQVLAAAQALSNDPQTQIAFYALVAPYAGSDTLEPGSTQVVTEEFSDGDYIAADTQSMTPVFQEFTVAGDPTDMTAPQPDFAVTENEFYFDAPATVNAGMNTVEVTNAGQDVHMMVLIRLDPGKTVQDVIDTLQNEGPNTPPPAWVHPVPGMPDLAPGRTAYTILNLDPGTYVMLCFDVDPATGQPHVAEGMIGSFTAQ